MENLLEASKLLVVGLSTVFIVLLLIIQGSKLLIKAVNRFAPAEDEAPKQTTSVSAQPVAPAVAKAIEQAVAQMTGGSAEVVKIEKL